MVGRAWKPAGAYYLARGAKHARQVAPKVLKPEGAAVFGAERFLAWKRWPVKMARQPNTDISDEEVVAEFEKRRATITRLAIITGIGGGAVLVLAYLGLASNTAAVLLFVIVGVYAAIVNVRTWRCPSCSGHLGKLYLGLKEPKHCPNCGIRLIEE